MMEIATSLNFTGNQWLLPVFRWAFTIDLKNKIIVYLYLYTDD